MYDLRGDRSYQSKQFTDYLKKMHQRAHIEGHGCCFIIFEESPDDDGSDEHLDESVELPMALVNDAARTADSGDSPLDDSMLIHAPREDFWQSDKGPKRFVQFSFERNWFCLDMPNNTLFKPEADKILRERSGFFYLRDLPQFTLYGEDVEGHDPFRKIYLYGDERSAAEDIAYIFFDVWRFPVDWTFYVTAAAFGDGPSWESDQRME